MQVNFFKGSTGLNTKAAPHRITFNPETGISDLVSAVNVDVESNKQISRRKGYETSVRTESTHSLYSDGNNCLYISGQSMYRLNRDFSRTGIRSGLTDGAVMEFCSVGDKVYYTNGFENGYVKGNISYVWEGSSYVGPTTYRTFSNPPVGTILEWFNGRMYIVQGKTIWYSEPFAYNWYSLSDSFLQFASNVIMLRTVTDGIYVGTDNEVFFLGGVAPKEFTWQKVSSVPVIKGTALRCDAGDFGDGSLTGKAVCWNSQSGIFLGVDGGKVKNLTKEKIESFPRALQGTSTIFENKWLTIAG